MDTKNKPMTTDEAREYLITFMEQNFTDTTFHRYIRGQRVDCGLAGDFAYQMATALRRLATPAQPIAPPTDVSALRKVIHELRTYSPPADRHNGVHIHPAWADQIEAAIAPAAAPFDAPIGPFSKWTAYSLYELACRQKHEIIEGSKCIKRYQALLSELQPIAPAADVSAPTDDVLAGLQRYALDHLSATVTRKAARAAAPVSGPTDHYKASDNSETWSEIARQTRAKMQSAVDIINSAAPVSGQGASIGGDDKFWYEVSMVRLQKGHTAQIKRAEDHLVPFIDQFIDSRPRSEDSRALTPPPADWRDVIAQARDGICAGGLAEYAQHERSIVEPHLDGIYDELEALEKAALASSEDSRAKVLEEAAMACDLQATWSKGEAEDEQHMDATRKSFRTQQFQAEKCAEVIRALASTPPKADNE